MGSRANKGGTNDVVGSDDDNSSSDSMGWFCLVYKAFC